MIYPNNTCAKFCTWLLTSGTFRLTPGRIVQITAIQTAANSATSVTDTDYNQFIQYTGRMYYYYEQWISMQPVVLLPPTLDTLTTAWLSACTAPSVQTIYAVDTFFKQLRNDGNLLFDYFYLFAQDQQANAKIELFNPGTRNIIEVATPTWTANQGYTGDGATMYLNTGFIDSVNAVNYTLNSGMLGFYGRKNLSTGVGYDMGSQDGFSKTVAALDYGGNVFANLNSTTSATVANTLTQGLATFVRTDANTVSAYLNNNLLVTNGAAPSYGLSAYSDYIMGYNGSGALNAPNNNQYACAFKCSGAINQTLLNSAVNTLMTNLGAHY